MPKIETIELESAGLKTLVLIKVYDDDANRNYSEKDLYKMAFVLGLANDQKSKE